MMTLTDVTLSIWQFCWNGVVGLICGRTSAPGDTRRKDDKAVVDLCQT